MSWSCSNPIPERYLCLPLASINELSLRFLQIHVFLEECPMLEARPDCFRVFTSDQGQQGSSLGVPILGPPLQELPMEFFYWTSPIKDYYEWSDQSSLVLENLFDQLPLKPTDHGSVELPWNYWIDFSGSVNSSAQNLKIDVKGCYD